MAAADELRRLYVDEQKSIPQIAEAIGWPRSRVRSRLIEAGVPMRQRGDGVRLRRDVLGQHAKGKRRFFTKEWCLNISLGRLLWSAENAVGHRITQAGYVEFTTGPHKGRLVHDVMMEDRLGRRLRPGETVHFIDEDRQNNDPDNHELLTRADHARLHRLKEQEAGKFRRRDRNGRFT